MSWLFSQALVEAFSPPNSAGIEPCAQLNVMPTLHPFWRLDKTMEASDLSRFGLTYAVLTEDRGAELLTAFLAAFPAKTSQAPAVEPESKVPGLDSGERWFASWVKYDPVTSAWRTRQFSLLGDSGEFLGTWPRWGLMLDGECWALDTLERPMPESESGYWPTPTTVGKTGGAALCKWGGSHARAKLKKMVSHKELNGPLNPEFASWLMGWPTGWTSLTPLETDKFREWQRQHGAYLEPERIAA